MLSELEVPWFTARKAATIEPMIQTVVRKIIATKNRPFSKSTEVSSIRNLSLPQTVSTVDSRAIHLNVMHSFIKQLLEIGGGKESFGSGKSL
jgi:hypothetical protein